MAIVVKDRVKVTSTTTGTSDFTLGSASLGFQDFAVIGNSNDTYYAAVDPITGDWEVGIGTYTTAGPTLTRTTILESSAAGAKVTFGSGPKDVFCTYPAERSVYLDTAGSYPVQSTFNALTAASIGLTTGTISTQPGAGTDIANKTYVDTVAAQGLTYHAPVYVESPDTAGNLNALYNQPGGAGVGVGATLTNNGTKAALVIDNVLMTTTKRVLIYNQTNAFENGVYTVTTVGTPDPGGTNWVLTRATDADTYAPADPDALGQGDAFFVTAGDTGAGELYACNTIGAITFGTTAITFVQISASIPYLAGTGLNLNPATTFNISNVGTAGTYGSSSNVPVFVTNAQGQVTSVTNTGIAITSAAVSGLAASATTDTTNASNITSGTLPSGRITGTYTGLTGTGALAAGSLATGFTAVSAALGGTGQTTYTIGDLIYADTSTSFAKLPDAAVGNALISGGVGSAPSWGKIGAATHISGTLPVANGGTGVTASTGTIAVVLSNSPTLVTPNLGTPSTLVGTNITGTAAGLTAGTVTTNANLTGGVTSVGNVATVVTNANLTGDVTSVGNTTTLATVNTNVGSFTNASVTVNGKGLITAASSGTAPVTSVTGTSPVASSGGATPAISLSAGYGDTLNPYASKTAKYFLAAPNGSAGVPVFRAIVASDVPTLNQNTTGTAANVTGTVAVANGGTGTTTPSLVAGTNVTISGTWPNQTVAASGGGGGGSPATPCVAGTVYGKTGPFICCTGSGGNANLGYTAGANCQSGLAVAVGNRAGENAQGQYAVAIGANAGRTNQTAYAVAIGSNAGASSQHTSSVAIGKSAGSANQQSYAVAVGACAGSYLQSCNAVAVGAGAGAVGQGLCAVAIGTLAALNYQSSHSVAIGNCAGKDYQGGYSVAIGASAGKLCQSYTAVSIGASAGYSAQGGCAVAIGTQAGMFNQGIQAIAIGYSAGQCTQSSTAIAIGAYAGGCSQPYDSIAIGPYTNATGTSQTHIGPMRNAVTCHPLYYCPCTREITYG